MQASKGRTFIGRFEYGEDLLLALTGFCNQENIKVGTFYIIGAVTEARLGYYDQSNKEYNECVALAKKLEIASCMGNISSLNNEIFIHAHIVLADHDGVCYGGHLMPGTVIFAAEYYIQELTTVKLDRKFDPLTGLQLWCNATGND
jgi:predicted DNA-binding protein with PD1-like motif